MPPHHRSRKSPGAKPLTSERDQYRALMRQGLSNAAASRIVGVNRKTGHRWRYGRSVTTRTGEVRTYPAITSPAPPVSARYLSEGERISIADGLIHGRACARSQRGRSCTVHDQPGDPAQPGHRDRDLSTRSGPSAALPAAGSVRAVGKLARDSRAPDRRGRPPRAALEPGAGQHGRCAALFPDRPEMRVAPETIYQALYARGPVRCTATARACSGAGVHRKRRRRSGERLGRFIAPMVMIDERPPEVADRAHRRPLGG